MTKMGRQAAIANDEVMRLLFHGYVRQLVGVQIAFGGMLTNQTYSVTPDLSFSFPQKINHPAYPLFRCRTRRF